MAGVAQGIWWAVFSPIPAPDGGSVGIVPFMVESAMNGDFQEAIFRSGQLPSLFGLIVTGLVLAVLVYVQGIHIDIPIVSTKYRGFKAVYPIKSAVYFKHPGYIGVSTTCQCCFHWPNDVGKL